MKKEYLRRFIKLAVQPMFHPRVPFKVRRILMKSAVLLQRKQPGVTRSTVTLGQVSAYQAQVAQASETQASEAQASETQVLYLHGGGYVFGDVATHRQVVDGIALIANATVWMPTYRLAPEHPFPAALDDAFSAYQALLSKGVSADNIIIAGDSAGGGLALALALRLRDEGQPLPRGLVLFSPWVDLTVTRTSHVFHAKRDPMLLPAGLQSCAEAYCGSTPHDHPYCSPLFADFSGLPPVCVQVGSDEILYDDAIELHQSLLRANVTADLQVFDGMWHVFQLHCHQLPEATAAVTQAFHWDFISRNQ